MSGARRGIWGSSQGSLTFLERDLLLCSRKLYNWSHSTRTGTGQPSSCPSLRMLKDLLVLVGPAPCSLACLVCLSSHITRHLPQSQSASHDPVVTAPSPASSTISRTYLRGPSILCLGCELHSATAAGICEPSGPLQQKMSFWDDGLELHFVRPCLVRWKVMSGRHGRSFEVPSSASTCHMGGCEVEPNRHPGAT